MAIFDPLQNQQPLTDCEKLCQMWYVGNPYSFAIFGAHQSTGGDSVRMGEIWPKFFYLYLFLGTHLQVRLLLMNFCAWLIVQTTWNDVHVHKQRARMCLFGFHWHYCPFRGSSPPKTPILGTWIGIFEPGVPNIDIHTVKTSILIATKFCTLW